jgi:hypothetical protein
LGFLHVSSIVNAGRHLVSIGIEIWVKIARYGGVRDKKPPESTLHTIGIIRKHRVSLYLYIG